MLKELEIGKEYHVKSLETLKKEFIKYRSCSNQYDYRNAVQKFEEIANKTFTIYKDVGERLVVTNYNPHVHAYGINFNDWVIYPHEVIEFDQKKETQIKIF